VTFGDLFLSKTVWLAMIEGINGAERDYGKVRSSQW